MLDEKKKTMILAGSVIVLLLISLALVVFSPKTYVVEFDDGISTYSIAVKKNEKLYKPITPSKEGYIFLGWYKDGFSYDFDTEVKEDFSLIAKFQREGGEEVEIPEETTTVATTTEPTTTVDSKITTKTTKKVTTKAPVVTTAPTTAAPTTTAPTTTRPTTTVPTTTAVTYSVVRVDVANSTIGQQMIYVKNNSTGAYVSGTVTITYTAGNSATVSVPASGLMVVKSTVASVSNARGN